MSGGLALLVIDLQNAYFELPGLAGKEERLVGAANELIAAAHEGGRPVVLIRTEHQPDRSTWTVNMLDDGEGFAFPQSRQAAFLDGLDTRDHIEVVKTRDNSFFGTDLAFQLRSLDVEQILLCGISTHSCVAQTAIGAFAEDFRVSVAGEAIASDHQPLSEALLEFLKVEMRQPVLSQQECVALLRGDA